MKAEYLTKITDYDLSLKQEVFYVLSRSKMKSEVMSEKIRIPVECQLRDELPLDSKITWRISPYSK